VGARSRPWTDVGIELTDFGFRIRAQRFRREHPGASEEDVEASSRAGSSPDPVHRMAMASADLALLPE